MPRLSTMANPSAKASFSGTARMTYMNVTCIECQNFASLVKMRW